MNGWRFHTDGVHLNSRAGNLAADLIQDFLEGQDSISLRLSQRQGSSGGNVTKM